MKTKKFAVSACTALLLAGCQTLPVTTDSNSGKQSETKSEKTSSITLTKYLAITDPNWNVEACPDKEWPCPGSIPDAYTRVHVTTQDIALTNGGSIDEQQRANANGSVLERIFNPKNNTFIMTIKVSIDGSAEGTAPNYVLLTRNDDENDWNTEIVTSRVASPYFLTKPDTRISVEFATNSEELSDPRYAKLLLQAAENVAEAAIPGSKLATTLAKPSTDKTQRLIDNTLESLMSSANAEKISSETTISKLQGKSDWNVSLFLQNKKSRMLDKVGTWKIKFSNPRPSIFSSLTYEATDKDDPKAKAKRAYSKLNSSTVLDVLRTGESGESLRQLLQSQTWFADAFRKANQKVSMKDGIDTLCKKSQETIDSEGVLLSETDKAAVTWALLRQVEPESDNPTLNKTVSEAKECSGVWSTLQEIGLDNSL